MNQILMASLVIRMLVLMAMVEPEEQGAEKVEDRFLEREGGEEGEQRAWMEGWAVLIKAVPVAGPREGVPQWPAMVGRGLAGASQRLRVQPVARSCRPAPRPQSLVASRQSLRWSLPPKEKMCVRRGRRVCGRWVCGQVQPQPGHLTPQQGA